MDAGPDGPDGTNAPMQDLGALLALLLAAAGTVHAFRIGHGMCASQRPANPAGGDPAVARALAVRARLADPAALAAAGPGPART